MSGPWEWLLFIGAAALVAVLVASFAAGVVASFREKKPCEKCGHVNTDDPDKTP